MHTTRSQRLARHHSSRALGTASRTPMVCVVDPKADDYAPFHALAKTNGLRLEIVATAEAALRLSRSQAIDLWIVNTALPGLSGIELCELLKSRSARNPVYLVADEYSPTVERAAWQSRATLFGCKGGHIEWLKDWLQTR